MKEKVKGILKRKMKWIEKDIEGESEENAEGNAEGKSEEDIEEEGCLNINGASVNPERVEKASRAAAKLQAAPEKLWEPWLRRAAAQKPA